MNQLGITDHARARIQQRGINEDILPILLKYGKKTYDSHGGMVVFLNKSGRERIERECDRDVLRKIRDRLNSALRQSMDSPAVKTMLSGFGYRIIASSSSEMGEAIQHDLTSYRVLARSGRVTPE